MPRSVSAFITKDGVLYEDRSAAEKHEIMQALIEKFGEKAAIELQVIVDERDWFERLFSEVRRDFAATLQTPRQDPVAFTPPEPETESPRRGKIFDKKPTLLREVAGG